MSWPVVSSPGAELVLFIVSCGLVTGGIGITVAHELGQKNPNSNNSTASVTPFGLLYALLY